MKLDICNLQSIYIRGKKYGGDYIILNERLSKPLMDIKNGNSKIKTFETEEKALQYIREKAGEEPLSVCSIEKYMEKENKQFNMIEKEQINKQIMEYLEKSGLSSLGRNTEKNIYGFELPGHAKNNEDYIEQLKREFKELNIFLNKKNYPSELIKEVNKNCRQIISALRLLIEKKEERADEIIKEVLKTYIENKFAVSELGKSYAFKGVAPFEDLHSPEVSPSLYEQMLDEELTFFRARVVKKSNPLSEIKDIISLPYSKRNLSKDSRFSVKDKVCLYLGVTSHVCIKECRWKKGNERSDDIYISAFKINDKLKVFNLVIFEGLINGLSENDREEKNLKYNLIKVYPLALAASFKVERNGDENETETSYEYLLSQSIMRVIKSLSIDGVAYLSTQGKAHFPHEVNLAIPMEDIKEDKEYSDLYKYFCCTKPISVFAKKDKNQSNNEKSYINRIFAEYIPKEYLFTGKKSILPNVAAQVEIVGKRIFYEKTCFSKLDDYLCNQEFDCIYKYLS